MGSKGGIKGIDIIVKRQPTGYSFVRIGEGGVVHVDGGADDASEMRYLRQIGEFVHAAVTGTLQSVTVSQGAGGSPILHIVQKAVVNKGVAGF